MSHATRDGLEFGDIREFCTRKLEAAIDWNRIEGNWKQVKGKAKEKWGTLTDDELEEMNGRRDQLEGKIQQRYGIAKDQAKKDIEFHKVVRTATIRETARCAFDAPGTFKERSARLTTNTSTERHRNRRPTEGFVRYRNEA